MKKYVRNELYNILKNCDIRAICTEVYDTIDTKNLVPLHTDDSKFMESLNTKLDNFREQTLNASIITIKDSIPCLVIHNKQSKSSISEIRIPFHGDTEKSILYKIYDIRMILELLSEDDSELKQANKYSKLNYSFI